MNWEQVFLEKNKLVLNNFILLSKDDNKNIVNFNGGALTSTLLLQKI